MNKVWSVISILFLSLSILSASLSQAENQTPSTGLEALHQANDFYNKGLYREAATHYERAADQIINGHIYYNLANAYYRLGEIGKAIYNYRRALVLLPADPDIKTNLQLARKQTKDHLGDERSLPRLNFLVLTNYFPEQTMYWLFIAAYLGFWLIVVLQYNKQNVLWKLSSLFSALIMLWIGASYFIAVQNFDGTYTLGISTQSRNTLPGVVLSPTVNVYSGDSDRYQVVFILHQGAEILVTEQRDNWIKILLPDGKQGWSAKKEIGLIR